jgi:acyl-CoA synthetase (AMP-forming)/AMP-acid ligase II
MSLGRLLQIGSANLNPDPALVLATQEEQVSISYDALQHVCRTLTKKIQLVGLGSGDVVGLVSPHSLETAMALVGLATSGFTCAPMDPATSTKRFKEILKETSAKLLLVGGLFHELIFSAVSERQSRPQLKANF